MPFASAVFCRSVHARRTLQRGYDAKSLHRLFHIMDPHDARAVHGTPHGYSKVPADVLTGHLFTSELLHYALAARTDQHTPLLRQPGK